MNEKPDILANLLYSRPVLPRLDEQQLIYVLLTLTCPPELKYTAALPLHLCLIVDRSTSMAGERIDMVKANIIQLVEQLKPDDILTLISFSDRADIVVPPTKVADIGKFRQRVSQITTGGGTEIFQGLELGVTQLRGSQASNNSIPHLILLTDGHTYGDEERSYQLVHESTHDGIIVSVLGIGSEWNDVFLDHLAGLSGGNALFVSSPVDLKKYLVTKADSMSMAYAKKLSLKFTPNEVVQLTQLFRISPETAPLNNTSPISLGNLIFDKKTSLLFEFRVEKIPEEINKIQIFKGSIEMELLAQGKVQHEIDLEFESPIQEGVVQPPVPDAIFQAISHLSLYRLQERARLEVADGNIMQATHRLQRLASHLFARGDSALAQKVLTEVSNIRGTRHFSENGDKAIKYGTRSLFSSDQEDKV